MKKDRWFDNIFSKSTLAVVYHPTFPVEMGWFPGGEIYEDMLLNDSKAYSE